jgi:hypothetical protein
MNKFKYYFILLITMVTFFSCSKNNTPDIAPPRDYAVQYATDNTDIEEYLKTYYITVTDHPGMADDQDVTFTKIPEGGTQPSIYSYLGASSYPRLMVREVSKDLLIHNVAYKIYYLVLRPGSGQSPTNVDGVLASYHGEYLERTSITTNGVTTTPLSSTFFEELKNPQSFFSLNTTVTGWSEIFPQFKTGTYSSNADGTVSHTDFGAGVMFIPSGLGYFNYGSGLIPAYAPLVFSFKLYEIQRLDQDNDGIPSYLEDIKGDNYLYDYRNTTNYSSSTSKNLNDTDGDTIPDYLDVDDDGDGYTTKLEIKNPATGIAFPFANIPTCTSAKKNYLDSTCHP